MSDGVAPTVHNNANRTATSRVAVAPGPKQALPMTPIDTPTSDEKPHSFKRGDPLAHCGKSSSHYRSHRWTASPVAAQPSRHARVPTASRYSFSKRACSAVPRFHSSQKRSSASSNSASRPVLDAFARATMVGPYRALKCSP